MQNSKEVLNIEQANPMAIIRIVSGEINETQFLEGFRYMFSWNWQWRCKKQGHNAYLMRFPNKSRLVELHKFGDFNLLGTKAVVNVDSWTYDTQAVGKLHTVLVRFQKVPECFRQFFGMCEVAAAVGPVLEIDMSTIFQEKIRAKVGVRDFEKIPAYTEVTDKDLMIYRIYTELEVVVEHGWYDEKRKHDMMEEDQNEVEKEMMKKLRTGECENDGGKEKIELGSLNLKQFEELKKKGEELLKMQNDHLVEMERRKKVEADLEKVMMKLQEMEEGKQRQEAWRSIEEKKMSTGRRKGLS